MEKPRIIKKLEKKINKELKELDMAGISKTANGYVVDGRGNIRVLNLNDANISDISFLKDFHHLNHLCLFNNQIADISSLKELKKLNWVFLKDNKIIQLPDELVEL